MPNKVTVKQIAEKLGVSMMTVSRALNNQPNVDRRTRDQVVKTAREMGYVPNHIAKSLVQKKTYTIGVVVPEITHSFFPEAIRGIEEAANSKNYQLILTHSAENAAREVKAIQTLLSKRVDGVLISTAESVKDINVYIDTLKRGIPMVFFDRCVQNIGASCVKIDDTKSCMEITEYLISKGFKKIAHLAGPSNVSIGRDRLKGFKKALSKHKIKPRDNYIVESGFHESGGYKAMKKLLELPASQRPRAIVAVNDPAAFGAMRAITEEGYEIPKDFAIVGFSDDIRAELMSTPLTTVRQPAYEVGKKAAEKLIKHIENEKEKTEDIIIQTELVIRKSSER